MGDDRKEILLLKMKVGTKELLQNCTILLFSIDIRSYICLVITNAMKSRAKVMRENNKYYLCCVVNRKSGHTYRK